VIPERSLASDGFVVVRRVIDDGEVQRLRDQIDLALDERGIHKAGGTVLPNAAAEAPELSWVFAHPSIIETVRSATGMEEMVFTMEADLHRNYIASNWHKDSGEQMMEDGYFGCDCFTNDDCRVVKVALYLQDARSERHVLHVKPGTIRTGDLSAGTDTAVMAGAGDAVLFDVRLTHRGVQPGLVDSALLGAAKAINHRSTDPLAARLRRCQARLMHRPDRLAVYFAFGAPTENWKRFAQRNMRRQLSQLCTEASGLPQSLVDSFRLQNVATVDLA
jgi:hypothetical protein